MLQAVTDALTTVISWIGTVISALVTGGDNAGGLNALLPLFAISVSISVVFLGVKAIKSIVWGA